MRIVHCEDFFHPDTGYQLNILAPLMQKRGHQVIIVTSELDKLPPYLRDFFGKDDIVQRDTMFTQETGVQIIRVPIWFYYSGRSIYKPGYFKFLDTLKPDVLYFHGEDTYLGIRALLRLHRFACPVVFDDHMTDIASKHPLYRVFRWGYRTFMAPIINKNRVTVMRAMEDDFVMKHYGIDQSNAPYIGFGSNLSLFRPNAEERLRVRQKLGIPPDDFVFLYAGKLDEAKGGLLLAQALRDRLPTERSISFIVIGNVIGNSDDYAKQIEQAFSKTENRIIRLPTQPYRQLARYFQAADVALFPKQCSLTYFDVQACGLPVILEDVFINKERVGQGNGVTFKAGNVQDFREKMLYFANMPFARFQEMQEVSIRHIEKNYNYEQVTDNCMHIINEAIRRYAL